MILFLALLTPPSFLVGCAELPKKSDNTVTTKLTPNDTTPSAVSADHNTSTSEVRELLAQFSKRIDTLETQISSMNDKLDANRVLLDRISGEPKIKGSAVIAHPSESQGEPIEVRPTPHDPELGFINDDAIQTFRKAMILFQAQKYPESILAYSSFLEKFPDHPLAGSAQFYIGEAYINQKEFKLALQEFQHVLTSYDRSAHVADTLSEMAQAEESLKKSQFAAVHRQLLTSLFPQSPAASTSVAAPTDTSPSQGPRPASTAPTSTVEDPAETTVTATPPPTVPLINQANQAGESLQEQ